MTIDVKSYKEKVLNRKPAINLVPLIDILFTIMIFLVVTSNFSATDMSADDASSTDSGTGKPNVTDVSGDAEYYIMPVANLHKVVVDGKDMSNLISNNAIAVKANVIDEGQIQIKPGEIIITTP
ncbi:MAG: ExbD/TolR family protein, partial [Methanobrevibacter smithii]